MAKLFPTLDEVKKMAKSYDIIPLSFEMLADYTSPMLILRKMKAISDKLFLLESVEGGEKWGRYSFLGMNPEKTVSIKDGNCIIEENGVTSTLDGSPTDIIRKLALGGKTKKFEHLPIFTGGAVGYFGYDTFFYNEKINLTSKDVMGLPDCVMLFFNNIIAFDHMRQKLVGIVNLRTDGDIESAYSNAEKEADKMRDFIKTEYVPMPQKSSPKPVFKSNKTYEQFAQMVEKGKEYIKNGDIFQAVLSQRLEAYYPDSLMNAYRVLRTINPSPYMYYLQCGELEVAGASPETLVRVKDGEIFTFPIAGTRKRGVTTEADKATEADLLSDAKEISEHNMLVDLARNDVGKVAEIGSVNVEKYMAIQRFSHVMHITSEVRGKKLESLDSLDVLGSILPAGTLSGAPKIRAAEIIDELEGERRGVYGGGLGYVGFDGNLDFAITIRTAVKFNGKVSVQAGGGIVLDSIPKNEFEESLNKAGAMIKALELAAELE